MCRFLGVGWVHSTMQPGAGKEIDPIRVLIVTVQWTIGPRTATWDELWRRIVFAPLDNPDVPTGDSMTDQPTPDYRSGVEEEEIDAL